MVIKGIREDFKERVMWGWGDSILYGGGVMNKGREFVSCFVLFFVCVFLVVFRRF